MIMNFGDVEYGGTTDKNRGCKKRNMKEDDFIRSMLCVLLTLQYVPCLASLKHLE